MLCCWMENIGEIFVFNQKQVNILRHYLFEELSVKHQIRREASRLEFKSGWLTPEIV